MLFAFVNVIYEDHINQSTTDGYKSHLCFLVIANRKTKQRKVWFLICFPNWITPNGKAKDGIYRRYCFSVFGFFMFRMKNENRYNEHYSYSSFSVFKLGMRKKRKRKLDYIFLFSVMESEIEEPQVGIYSTWCFSFFPIFILQMNKKKKIGITDHISIFRHLFVD